MYKIMREGPSRRAATSRVLLPDRPAVRRLPRVSQKRKAFLRQVEQRAVFVEDAMNDLQAGRNGLWTLSAG